MDALACCIYYTRAWLVSRFSCHHPLLCIFVSPGQQSIKPGKDGGPGGVRQVESAGHLKASGKGSEGVVDGNAALLAKLAGKKDKMACALGREADARAGMAGFKGEQAQMLGMLICFEDSQAAAIISAFAAHAVNEVMPVVPDGSGGGRRGQRGRRRGRLRR